MNFDVISPLTREELLRSLENMNGRPCRFGAGYTDLVMELKEGSHEELMVINLARLQDEVFKGVRMTGNGMYIGALTPVADLVYNDEVQALYPVMHQAAWSLASPQIREVATVGGNLCTASPAGDVSTALVALQATCLIMNSQGEVREVPVSRFIKGVRQTDLGPGEVLQAVIVPQNRSKRLTSGFEKVGTRRSMECSVVSLAWHWQLDGQGRVQAAGLAIGSAAPLIPFCEEACQLLMNKNPGKLNKQEKEAFVKAVMSYANPISDIRATAWYRKEVLANLARALVE